MINNENSTPKKGMNRHSHPSEVSNTEYTFGYNVNIQDNTGDGDLIVVNEPSNIKCLSFKPGYSLLKQKYDRVRERIYLFLVNEETGCSEIGYISSKDNNDPNSVDEYLCGCKEYAEDGIALEELFQEDTCGYTSILSDFCTETGICTGCLNFSTRYPILNVVIRHSILGDELYWDDGHNPDRYLKLYDLDSYTQNIDNCSGEIEETCLQCDKLRLFTIFNKPCISLTEVVDGGALRAGMYSVFGAYSDIDGTELSDYFSGNGAVSIFDKNNTILDQTQLDYITSQAIKVELTNLDKSFEYYKIVVAFSTGNDAGTIYKTYGVFPIDQEIVVISQVASSPESNASDAESGGNVNATDILTPRAFYNHSKLMTSANGYLFLGDLDGKREINLQPVVNLMGSLAKWRSAIAKENLYEFGSASANYKTFYRDETYPFSIRFNFRGGYNTANFPFIARPPFPEEIDEMPEDNNRLSIEQKVDNCGDFTRDRVWQFKNTAESEGYVDCETTSESTPIEVVETHSCTTNKTFNTLDGVIERDLEGSSLQTWINNNIPLILASSDLELSIIKDALSDASYYGNCEPNVTDRCEDPKLIDEEISVIEVVGEQLEDVSIPYDQYDPVPPPSTCERLVEPLANDTAIETILGSGSTVYEKITPTNTTCSSATLLMDYPGSAFYSLHLKDMGTTSASSALYDSSIPVTLIDDDFKPFLHKNAIWIKVQFFNNSGKIIANISNAVCGTIDDNTNNKVRITVFDGCPTLTEKPVYGKIINDITTTGNPDLFIEMNSSDFTGQNLSAYIAIDSPMFSEMEIDLTVTGTSGAVDIEIDGDTLPMVYTGGSTTATASAFITTNSALLTSLGITASSSGNVVKLIMNENQYNSLTITSVTPDLDVTSNIVSQKHLLQPPCGCFTAYRRIPTLRTVVTYDDIIFAKTQTYEYTCTYDQIPVKDCEVAPRFEGLFSYVESTLKYPCNSELFDSSGLVINIDHIPSKYQSEFEGYYVDNIVSGNYILTQDANFMDKNIRHFKFPDNSISSFLQTNTEDYSVSQANNCLIVPIGFYIDNDVINGFLDVAVDNGLLTAEERNDIIGYEIFRGDRATERSVVAKGLLYDMRYYQDDSTASDASSLKVTYYPNYPLNEQSPYDRLNGIMATAKTNNFFYTFHSPDTHFRKPALPNELGIEGYQSGLALNTFAPVKDHAEWVLLGKKALDAAGAIAGAEVAFEVTMQALNFLTLAASGSGFTYVLSIIVGAVSLATTFIMGWFQFGKYKYQWLQSFENFGNPHNFAYYGISKGIYRNFIPNLVGNSTLRGLGISTYIKDGRKSVVDESAGSTALGTYSINNHNREDSVVVKFDEAFRLTSPSAYTAISDTSMLPIPTDKTGILGEYARKTSSPYATLKRFLPNQWGSINSISWVQTGYCGDLSKSNSCDIVFGGDIFISRFALKRKLPFFTTTAVGLAPNTPIKYSSYFNINTGWKRSYVNYKTGNSEMASGFFTIPENVSEYSLSDGTSNSTEVDEFYVDDRYKFLLYYYGFPYFLVESEINCNYRYAGIEKKEDFYPNFGDIVDYTQEVNVPIHEPNSYKYNFTYSNRPHKVGYRLLPVDFSKKMAEAQSDLNNAIIASNQDNKENSQLRSPWLNYKPSDFHRFSKKFGDLVDLKSIESEMLWARFTDGYEILNTIDILAERQTPQTRKTGMGGMFQQRAINFNVTDLGHNGTQHRETISTEFGHYSVDAKRGKVFELSPGAKGVTEISQTLSKWFKEQLPFKILKQFPELNIDDPYNGLGISMGWDDRTKRLFLTKLDYICTSDEVLWDNEDGLHIIEIGGRGEEVKVRIKVTDENYFKPCHWTIAYSPLFKMWISYYSFHPFYYITLNDHFKTGLNLLGSDKHGIWSHYPLLSSHQVFYGELHPFILEYALQNKGGMSKIDTVEFLADVRRYYNKFDFSNIFDKIFNKAYIYNDKTNTGELELKVHNNLNRRELIDYPKHKQNSTEILIHQNNDFWSFNTIFNNVRNDYNRLPIWINDDVDILKDINLSSMDFKRGDRNRLHGDYFLVRLIQDEESRNKIALRFLKNQRNFYN